MTETVETETHFGVRGMTCANCSARVERALKRTEGVFEANVNLATERATVRYDPAAVGVAALHQTVEDAGYAVLEESAARPDAEREARAAELGSLRRDLTVAAVLSAPLFVLVMLPMLVPAFEHWLMTYVSMNTLNLVGFALASAVQFGPGRRFYRPGWAALPTFQVTPSTGHF